MHPLPDHRLTPFPEQPGSTPWPTEVWPMASPTDVGADERRLDALLDALMDAEAAPQVGRTYACAVVARGHLVAERYGRRVVQDLRSLEPDPPDEALDAASPLLSWSMAKSITNLAVGVAVGDGHIELDQPVGDPRWRVPGDPRSTITWADLLTMRAGLRWREEYYDLDGDSMPDVVTMLFGAGASDMAAFAAGFPLVATPGSDEAYCYSSGTTNIVAANLQRALGFDAEAMDAYLHDRIFAPIGMTSATATFDDAGTFVGSSYVHATLGDWARFGLLALRGGRWEDQRVVPDGWMDWSRRARSWEDTVLHGAHWWSWDVPGVPFAAHGFEGQRIVAFPDRDLIVARFGRSGATEGPALNDHLSSIASCFPAIHR